MGTLFLPALQGSMGDWLYYVGLMRLSDLAERVKYAHDLQENPKLSEVIQRRLDDNDRAKDIAEYLVEVPDRFFGALVVGVKGGAPSWHPFALNARQDEHELGEVVEQDQDLVGYLELSGAEELFALDGQHRLAGIKMALERKAKLGNERVSVIFVGHKDDSTGLQRTRSLFVALNKKAVPILRRDIIVLDEVDLPAIISRNLVDTHPWFSKGQVSVDRFTTSIPANAREWTTLGNFYDTNSAAISRIMGLEHTSELREAARIRLSADRIAYYRELVVAFYEKLAEIEPSLREVFENYSADRVREGRAKPEPRLLFRPLGLKIVTRVLAELRRRRYTVEQSFAQLRRVPLSLAEAPFSNVIWDPARDKMNMGGESVATRLLLYMLGAIQADERLKRDYAALLGRPGENVPLPKTLPPA